MAYNSEEGSHSQFSAWAHKMNRIGKLLEGMNTVRVQPLAYNEESECFNFEIWHRYIVSLHLEVRPKMSEKEKKEADAMRTLLDKLIKTCNPLRETRRVLRADKKVVIVYSLWEILEKQLTSYEQMIRDSIDKHNMDSPNADESGLF